ncbi:MAG: hypothetical protein AVDCRST_MAG08-185, partial [uncultured Acetobacteraceae bacterium]
SPPPPAGRRWRWPPRARRRRRCRPFGNSWPATWPKQGASVPARRRP